jgi:hypothetical protein
MIDNNLPKPARIPCSSYLFSSEGKTLKEPIIRSSYFPNSSIKKINYETKQNESSSTQYNVVNSDDKFKKRNIKKDSMFSLNDPENVFDIYWNESFTNAFTINQIEKLKNNNPLKSSIDTSNHLIEKDNDFDKNISHIIQIEFDSLDLSKKQI